MLQAARVVGAELCSDSELILLFLVCGGELLGVPWFQSRDGVDSLLWLHVWRLNLLSAGSGSFLRWPSANSGIWVSACCSPATLSWYFGPAKLNRDLLPVWQGQDPKIVLGFNTRFQVLAFGGCRVVEREGIQKHQALGQQKQEEVCSEEVLCAVPWWVLCGKEQGAEELLAVNGAALTA